MMWHGVHTKPETESYGNVVTSTAQQVVYIANPGEGSEYRPALMEGSRELRRDFPNSRFEEVSELIPRGTILVGHKPLEMDRRSLFDCLMTLEAKLFCFDDISVDITFLDEISEFIRAKHEMGEWVQVVVESMVPIGPEERESLLDLASMMSVSTSEGMIEDGRQISLVLSQYEGAAIDFTVGLAKTLPGEKISRMEMSKKIETRVEEDWLGCYAEAGIIGFLDGERATVFSAVNLVQGGSPYRQLTATRVLQWYLSEWKEALRFIPGETIELGLYEVQRVTEELIVEYRRAGHISEATYGISFSAGTGEITCDIVLYPYYGVEGISGVGIARVQKG